MDERLMAIKIANLEQKVAYMQIELNDLKETMRKRAELNQHFMTMLEIIEKRVQILKK